MHFLPLFIDLKTGPIALIGGGAASDQGDGSGLEVDKERQEMHWAIPPDKGNDFLYNNRNACFSRTKFYQRFSRSWHKPCLRQRVSRRFVLCGRRARRREAQCKPARPSPGRRANRSPSRPSTSEGRRRGRCWSKSWRPASATLMPTRCQAPTPRESSRRF